MTHNNTRYLKFSLLIIKIFITGLTIILYFHYFHRQSWGYFTIEPRQPLINIYPINEGVLSNEPAIKNYMSYGMGISRRGIILYNQWAKIITTDKNLVWKKLNADSLASIIKNEKDISLINFDDLGIGKGRFMLTKAETVPFETIKKNKEFIPSQFYTITEIR